MDTVADKLREARALVAKGWTQGWYARSLLGFWRKPKEKGARRFCATGALIRVDAAEPTALNLLAAGAGVAAWELANWNDVRGRRKSDVLAAFDRAIELAEAGQ